MTCLDALMPVDASPASRPAILGGGHVGSWLPESPVVWLGAQSYGLYLSHLPLIMIVVLAYGGKVPVLVCAAVVPVAVFLGWAFHRWVETPSVALAQFLTGYRLVPSRRHILPGASDGRGRSRPLATTARVES